MAKVPLFEDFIPVGFGASNAADFGLGGGYKNTGYSMDAIVGPVETLGNHVAEQANSYETNDNPDHTSEAYIKEAKKHINDKIDEACENYSAMSESTLNEAKSDVVEIDIDFAGSKADLRRLFKKYNIEADEYEPGKVMLKGDKKDILAYLTSPQYDMDIRDIQSLFPELLESTLNEGTDIGSWNQAGIKGDANALVTTFAGPKDVESFGLGRKCMQINVGRNYVQLNPADIIELKDLLKNYKV